MPKTDNSFTHLAMHLVMPENGMDNAKHKPFSHSLTHSTQNKNRAAESNNQPASQ